VEDADGAVLWDPQPERTEALDPLVARLAVSLMEDVVARGTGYTGIRIVAELPTEVPAAGKTGTTNDGTDVWFNGFTPNLMASVWFGMDRPIQMAPRSTGGRFASPVWGEFMRKVYYGWESEDGLETFEPSLEIPPAWPIPEGLTRRRVDSKTGLLASEWCPEADAYDELFLPGTEPTVFCDRQGSGVIGGGIRTPIGNRP
jgi:penicillin-binding protein 1A